MARPKIAVGLAGWSYPDWTGVVYPRPLPKGFRELKLVSSWFDVAEVNMSYYRIPAPHFADKWLEDIQDKPDFRFTAKLWQGFTHERRFSQDNLDIFREFLDRLYDAQRLQGVLMQFPWSFKYSNESLEHISSLIHEFRKYPLIVEMRHDSWWRQEFFTFLSDRSVSLCNIDQPELPQNIKPDEVITGPIAYVRFHGRNAENWWAEEEAYHGARYDYLYNDEELEKWAERIRRIAERVHSIVMIMNNHVHGEAAINGFQLAHKFGVAKGVVPRALASLYPEQVKAIQLPVEAEEPEQQDLFDL